MREFLTYDSSLGKYVSMTTESRVVLNSLSRLSTARLMFTGTDGLKKFHSKCEDEDEEDERSSSQ